jgi:hypothetical protein
MKLFHDLRRVTELLLPYRGCWAVCGGVAAAIYRETPRYTADIDIALIDHPDRDAASIAAGVAEVMGYKPKAGFITDQAGKLIPAQALVIARDDGAGGYVGLDFLLPVLPWIASAVRRAQANLLDFGFAELPAITPEDLFVAKLFALQGSPERVTDLDDLISMAKAVSPFDLNYFEKRAAEFQLTVPAPVAKLLKKTGS